MPSRTARVPAQPDLRVESGRAAGNGSVPLRRGAGSLSPFCPRREPLVCGNFVGIGGAQSCFVVTIATDALRRVYRNINRNKVLRMADLGMFVPGQICKPLVGGSSSSAGINEQGSKGWVFGRW